MEVTVSVLVGQLPFPTTSKDLQICSIQQNYLTLPPSPRDIVENLFKIMDCQEPERMHPWYRGFKVHYEGGERGFVSVFEE